MRKNIDDFSSASYHEAILQRLQEYEEAIRNGTIKDPNENSDWGNSTYIGSDLYHERCIELIKGGCFVQPHDQGILVNEHYIVARSKWRVQQKNTWYPYGNTEQFIERYIKKNMRSYNYYKILVSEELSHGWVY